MLKSVLTMLLLSFLTFAQSDIAAGSNKANFTLPAGWESEYDEESGMHFAGSGDGKINLLIQELPVPVGQVIEVTSEELKNALLEFEFESEPVMANINGIDVYNLAGTGIDSEKDTRTLVLLKVFDIAPGVSVAMIAEFPGDWDSDLLQSVEDIAESIKFSK